MECKHKETRIHQHATKHNAPFCADIVICKDCGEILGLNSISISFGKGDVILEKAE